jgi:hypothetical protein
MATVTCDGTDVNVFLNGAFLYTFSAAGGWAINSTLSNELLGRCVVRRLRWSDPSLCWAT